MFASVLTILAASAVLVRGSVGPLAPAPKTVFTTGKDCTIAWAADTTATAAWKTTSIELMTGENFDMVHITTLTVVDGTVDGTYKYVCPEVTPNSNIYFYQFSAPGAEKAWTGRFTIAAADGTVTPAENPLQSDGKDDPWGVGALVDPSTASAAPGGASGLTASVSVPSSGTTAASVSTTAISTSRLSTAAAAFVTSSSSSSPSSASKTSAAQSSVPSNAALVLDARFWQSGAALVASGLTFALLL